MPQKTSNSADSARPDGSVAARNTRKNSDLRLGLALVMLLSVSMTVSGCFKEWKAEEVESWYEEKPQSFDDYMRLARVKIQKGETDKGVQLYNDGIRDLDAQFGENSDIRVATAAEELGTIQERLNRLQDSEVSFRKALDVRVKNLPPNHNDVKRSRQKLAGVLKKLFKADEAKEVLTGTPTKKVETSSSPAATKTVTRVRRHKKTADD
ncbi:MAG: tetratricopeptide repeat protein [Candidatus Melainabacteria bacterium]|nr:tetratricopeptide repeat protein [Candidatus Melainabacteria bacterium]